MSIDYQLELELCERYTTEALDAARAKYSQLFSDDEIRIDTIVLHIDKDGVCGYSGQLANDPQISFDRVRSATLLWQHNGVERHLQMERLQSMKPKLKGIRVYKCVRGVWEFSHKG